MGRHAPQGRVPRRLPLGDPRRLLHRRHRPPRAPPAGARPHHGQVFLGRNQGLIAHPAPPRAARPWLCPPPPAEPPLRRPTAHLPRSAPRGPAPRPADLALGCAASPKRCKRSLPLPPARLRAVTEPSERSRERPAVGGAGRAGGPGPTRPGVPPGRQEGLVGSVVGWSGAGISTRTACRASVWAIGRRRSKGQACSAAGPAAPARVAGASRAEARPQRKGRRRAGSPRRKRRRLACRHPSSPGRQSEPLCGVTDGQCRPVGRRGPCLAISASHGLPG